MTLTNNAVQVVSCFGLDCRQSVQTCTMTSARELLSVPGCFPVSRMLNCLEKTMASCFKSPRAAMSVFRHLQSACIRHRHDVTPKINST